MNEPVFDFENVSPEEMVFLVVLLMTIAGFAGMFYLFFLGSPYGY